MVQKLVLFAFLLFCCSICSVHGAQDIKVLQKLDENSTSAEIADSAQNKGFIKAALQVADDILPADLSKQRQKALKKILEAHIDDLVLSFAQQEQEQREDGFFLALRVSVDQKELKELLKKWGVYYTCLKSLPYQLHPKGFSPESWDDLENLQGFSGLVQAEESKAELFLQKDEEKGWRGRLVYKEEEWSQTGSQMQKVWLGLWAHYFALPEVKAKFIEIVTLKINGWVTTDGVMAFDDILGTWDAQIDDLQLLNIHMAPKGINAFWQLSTMDKTKLKKNLNTFVSERGLSFSLTNGTSFLKPKANGSDSGQADKDKNFSSEGSGS